MKKIDKHEAYIVSENLIRFGGEFEYHLGCALMCADDENIFKIKKTWPEIWEKYKNLEVK